MSGHLFHLPWICPWYHILKHPFLLTLTDLSLFLFVGDFFFTQHHMILKLPFPLTLMLHYLHRGCGCLLLSPPLPPPPILPTAMLSTNINAFVCWYGNFFLLHSFTSSNSPEDSSKTSLDQKGKSQETKESSSGQL